MAKSPMAASIQKVPRQARAKETYERLLDAAQDILVEQGFEAVTSNTIVERVGMTPPAFYRYFPNKQAVFVELGQRLMQAQGDVVTRSDAATFTDRNLFIQTIRENLERTLEATRAFKAGHTLLVLLRALPELRPVRTESHTEMAEYLGSQFTSETVSQRRLLIARSRLAIEFGYGAVEMLFETGFANRNDVLDRTAEAMAAIFDDLELH